jgi:hypothetical protein
VNQSPAHESTKPVHQPQRDVASPPSDQRLAGPPAPPIADGTFAGAAVSGGLRRTRVCVLCGHPLRAGQPMVRIQGSTIHARCSSTGRRS